MTITTIFSFILFSLLNVIIQTVKSIATIKCGKAVASIVNAVAYGLYTYIVVLTANDGIGLWFKIIVTAMVNLVGVYVVKYLEEKSAKDKLWKVEATFKKDSNVMLNLAKWAEVNKISYNNIDIGKHIVVNFYCNTKKDSAVTKDFIERYKGKYFVSETKIL